MLVVSKSNGPDSELKAKLLMEVNFADNSDKEDTSIILEYSYNKKIYDKTNPFFGDFDRVTISVDSFLNSEECIHKQPISYVLSEAGFELIDYIAGTCKNIKDGRVFKIGKVLKRLNEDGLYNDFVNSPMRASTKSDYVATVSKNLYDIASMSYERGWSSCMNLDNGMNKTFISNDLQSGTLVIYLHNKQDTDIKSPTARILLKPYYHYAFGQLNLFYGSEGTHYGTTNIDMEELGNYIAKEIHKSIIDRRYFELKDTVIMAKISSTVYEDDISSELAVNFCNIDFTNKENVENFSSDNLYTEQEIRKQIELVEDKNIFMINPEFRDYNIKFKMNDSFWWYIAEVDGLENKNLIYKELIKNNEDLYHATTEVDIDYKSLMYLVMETDTFVFDDTLLKLLKEKLPEDAYRFVEQTRINDGSYTKLDDRDISIIETYYSLLRDSRKINNNFIRSYLYSCDGISDELISKRLHVINTQMHHYYKELPVSMVWHIIKSDSVKYRLFKILGFYDMYEYCEECGCKKDEEKVEKKNYFFNDFERSYMGLERFLDTI